MKNSKIITFFTLIFLFIFFNACKSGNNLTDKEDKELETQLRTLLNEIVVELKTPKQIQLSPRTFIELSAIIIVSNYHWSKELIAKAQQNTNLPFQEEIEIQLTDKKQKLLETFGLTIEDFESYVIKHQKDFQEFIKKNKELVDKYNTLSSLIPTFEN